MHANDNGTNRADVTWHPGERVVTRDGGQAVVIGHDAMGNVIGVGTFDRVPRVIRPVCDSWGGEHDCAMVNAA